MTIFKNDSPFSVLVGDTKIKDPTEVFNWCRSIDGFVGIIETDVSDLSASDDIIYTYMFDTEEVANWFKLRWL